jgi:hypothetical protein
VLNCFDKKCIAILKTLNSTIITLQYASLSLGCQQPADNAAVCCTLRFKSNVKGLPLTLSVPKHNYLVTKARMRHP